MARRELSGWHQRSWAIALAAPFVLCGCDLPRDPEETLDRVRGGTMRVGVAIDDPWTAWEGTLTAGRPSGIEVEFAERFAKELDANVTWMPGSDEDLFKALERFELDLVIGGITDDTLWADRIGLSRTYAETGEGKHVVAVPPGENEFLLTLDKFLQREEEAIHKRLMREGPVQSEGTVE